MIEPRDGKLPVNLAGINGFFTSRAVRACTHKSPSKVRFRGQSGHAETCDPTLMTHCGHEANF
jgi:hypothetical protein